MQQTQGYCSSESICCSLVPHANEHDDPANGSLNCTAGHAAGRIAAFPNAVLPSAAWTSPIPEHSLSSPLPFYSSHYTTLLKIRYETSHSYVKTQIPIRLQKRQPRHCLAIPIPVTMSTSVPQSTSTKQPNNVQHIHLLQTLFQCRIQHFLTPNNRHSNNTTRECKTLSVYSTLHSPLNTNSAPTSQSTHKLPCMTETVRNYQEKLGSSTQSN